MDLDKLNNKPLLDGGMSSAQPQERMIEMGWIKRSFKDIGFKNQRGMKENLNKSGSQIF